MAVVKRDEPLIVTLAGATSDIEVMECKNNDGTQEYLRGMEAKSEKAKAAQAGVCHTGKEGPVLRGAKQRSSRSACARWKTLAKKVRQRKRRFASPERRRWRCSAKEKRSAITCEGGGGPVEKISASRRTRPEPPKALISWPRQ